MFSPRYRHLFANPPVTSHGGKPQRTRAPRLDHSSPVFSATGMHAPFSVGDTAQSKVFSSRGGAWARRRPRGLYGILQTPEAWPPARLKEVALARASLYRAGGLAVGRETGRSSCKRREGRQRVDRQSGPCCTCTIC